MPFKLKIFIPLTKRLGPSPSCGNKVIILCKTNARTCGLLLLLCNHFYNHLTLEDELDYQLNVFLFSISYLQQLIYP
jgi:hypothetical protein